LLNADCWFLTSRFPYALTLSVEGSHVAIIGTYMTNIITMTSIMKNGMQALNTFMSGTPVIPDMM
jgi:hypothetical protein